ncbi:unnamed protein product, partial [marine sediment metagenome]
EIIELRRTMKWPPEEGEYLEVTKEDGTKGIEFRCGGCGQLASLDDHEIDQYGKVTPSVVCPYGDEGCGWHVYVKLIDYHV